MTEQPATTSTTTATSTAPSGAHVITPQDLPDLPANMTGGEILWHCLRQNYHLDNSNAAIHCAGVRYSPLTFRIAEYLWNHFPSYRGHLELAAVAADLGSYAEDPGR